MIRNDILGSTVRLCSVMSRCWTIGVCQSGWERQLQFCNIAMRYLRARLCFVVFWELRDEEIALRDENYAPGVSSPGRGN